MTERHDDEERDPIPSQPVGRVQLPPDDLPEVALGAIEQPRLLVRLGLGVLMIALMLLALFVILSGAFEVVPG